MVITDIFIIAKNWKYSICLSVGKWLHKLVHSYRGMGYYSTIKGNKVLTLTHAASLLNLRELHKLKKANLKSSMLYDSIYITLLM